MKKNRITTTLIIALIAFLNLEAQEQFERTYRSTDWENYGLDIVQTSDMGYLLFSVGRHPDSTKFYHANVTKIEPKGDIQWSKNYDFEDELLANGELTLLENDSFAFSVLCFKVTLNKVVTKADSNGEVVWSTKVGETVGSPLFMPTGTGDLLATPDGGLALFDIATQQPAGSLSMMSRLDTAGNFLWSKTYESGFGVATLNQQTSDAENTLENGFIVGGGVTEVTSTNAYLMNLDSLGDVNWGKRYNLDIGNLAFSGVVTIEPTLDSCYIVGGTSTNTFQQTSGWVMKVDSIGRVLWTYLINDPTLLVPNNTVIHGVLPQNDGSVTVLGIQNLSTLFITRSFALNLSPDGTINWQNYFYESQDIQVNLNLNLENVIATQDGGNAAFGHVLDNDGLFGQPIPYVLKIDKDGSSACQDTSSFFAVPVDINVDSLNVMTDTLNGFLSIDIEAENYNKFSVPVLSLDAPSFCEGEPILHTFDATIPGAVSYEWNTGDTTAMITVTEEGMYTVMVRVEEDICYTMCDTTMISIIGPPMAEITPNFDGYCSTGFVILEAQGGNQFEWSTGEDTPIILVDELGTYSVTVTNQCGSSSTSVAIDQFPTAPEISINTNLNNYCSEGTAVLEVSGAEGAQIITWPDVNESGPIIFINDLSPVYSVIANYGECGTSTAEIQLDAPVIDLSILVNLDSFCTSGNAILTASATNTDVFEWSTGEITPSISVSTPGTYVVSAISEFCDDVVAETDITPCISPFDCVQIPNAFTPDGDSTNDSFWPVIPAECADIQVTEIQIYSRWGELVFETTDSNVRWDGNYNNDPAASDVYVYSIKFVNGVGERGTRKGDLTLLR